MQTGARTMKHVALAAGVSVMTVSRAFKSDSSVSEATRTRIRDIADALGYVFDSTAANLRTQKTSFVAVTVPSINNANFADTVDAVSDRLATAGMQLLLACSGYDLGKEERLIEQLLSRRPEAFVVTGGSHTARARRMLANSGIPVIETWDLPKQPIGHVVGFSNAATMHGMVDHLVAKGATRIAFIGGDADSDTRGADRRRGFIAAMRRCGLPADRLIAAGKPPISMREGAGAMGRLLDRFPDTQAVVCVSDPVAFGALTECQRRGVSVPGEIAIAGFGAYEIAEISHPTITTIDPHPRLIGTKAADLILQLLAAPPDAAPKTWTIRIDWHLRAAETA